MEATFRPMVEADLPDLVAIQERGSVAALAHVFPQESHPFPTASVLDRWRAELEDPVIAAYVAIDREGQITGFAARRGDELLHFGTSLESWGSGLASWLHDQLLATFPRDLPRLRLRVFEENGRARRFYEKLGCTSTGRVSRSSVAPHPVLTEYDLDRFGRTARG